MGTLTNMQPSESTVARTAGILKDVQPPLSAEQLREKAEESIAEDVVERMKATAGGSPWFKELYEHLAPMREETERSSGQDDIDTAIDTAVRAVRRRRS